MSYFFKTTILGPEVDVEGVFSPAESRTMIDPGCESEFEIQAITTVNGDEAFEVECLSEKTLIAIENAAFQSKTDEHGES